MEWYDRTYLESCLHLAKIKMITWRESKRGNGKKRVKGVKFKNKNRKMKEKEIK